MEKRILSTLPAYPGYKVKEDLGIIWAFDDDFRVLRNLWQMNESMTRAYDNLWRKAEQKGANAVLGINLCLAPEKSIPILQGTAVILEKEDD